MISITQQTIAGETVWLVLAEPNLEQPERITPTYATSVDEGLTGIQNRRPRRSVPLWRYTYTFTANESDAAELRSFFGALADERVAVPLWFDSSALGETLLTASQVKVGYDAGYANIAIGESGTTPLGATVVPLLVGRIKRTEHGFFNDLNADFEIDLLEDSPWAMRVDIAASDPGVFAFTPNWASEPTEKTSDLLDYDTLGDGREQTVEGDTLTRWSQSARFSLARADLASMLGFFKGRRGAYGAFAMDSFFAPGTDTPGAPLQFNGTGGRGYMRFARDDLRITLSHPWQGEMESGFVQVLDTSTEEISGRTTLFEIWSDADPSDVARITSHESPVTAGGQTYNPARIERGDIRSSIKIPDDRAEVELWLDDVPQVTPVLRHETDIPIKCRILEADLSTDPATTYVLRYGNATGWRLEGKRALFEVKPFNGVLSRKIPRFMLTRNCNYALFDGGCARINAVAMARANWEVAGEYWTQFGISTIRIVNLSGTAFSDAGYFKRGWVELGTGIDKQLRMVLSGTYYPSGDGWNDAHGASAVLHLVLDRPVRTDVAAQGAAIKAYPGCDGTYETCKSKFFNGDAFGGAPFAPSYIKERPMNIASPGK